MSLVATSTSTIVETPIVPLHKQASASEDGASVLFTSLAKRIDAESATVALARRWYDGQQEPPEVNSKTKLYWRQEQEAARQNFARPIVQMAASSIQLTGFSTEGNEELAEAVERARRETYLNQVLSEAVKSDLIHGQAWLMVAQAEDGKRVVTFESRANMTAVGDPLRRGGHVERALKVWRDELAGTDRAFLFYRDADRRVWREEWSRPMESRKGNLHVRVDGGSWSFVERMELSFMPIVTIRMTEDGLGCLLPHVDALRAADKYSLYALTAAARNSDRDRTVEVEDVEYAKKLATNENGARDMLQEAVDNGSGFTKVMPPGTKLTSQPGADFRPSLDALKGAISRLATQSMTPVSALTTDGSNQSAEAAQAAREPLVMRVNDNIEALKPSVELVMVKLIMMENPALLDGSFIEAIFRDPRSVTETEQTRATNMQLRSAAGVPFEMNAREAGYSTSWIEEAVEKRLEESFLAESQATAQAAIQAAVPAPTAPDESLEVSA